MVYRFRAGGPDASWTPVHYRGDARDIATGTPLRDIYDTNPLNTDFAAVDFDGQGDHVISRSAVGVLRQGLPTTPQKLRDKQGLTVQVWFRADDVSGSQVLLSNRNNGGFAIFLSGDQLVGHVYAAGGYQAVRSISRISAGAWYSVTLRAYVDGPTSDPSLILTLHIDHVLEGMELVSLAGGQSIVDSSIPLTLGIEAGQLDYPFNGRIHAATVRNYAMELSYLHVPALRDGGELMGAPSFEDGRPYGGAGSTWRPPDLSVDSAVFRARNPDDDTDNETVPIQATAHAFVPFVSDDYVVQGVAHSCEAGQSCSRNLLYLSYYWKTPGVETGSGREDVGCDALGRSKDGSCSMERKRNRSIIVEVDLDRKRVTRCWRLAGSSNEQRFGHVGGIAYFRGSVYVADSNKVTRYAVGQAPTTPIAADYECEELYREQFPSGNFREYPVAKSSYVSLFHSQSGHPEMVVGSSGDHGSVRVYRYGVDAHGNLSENYTASYWVPYSTQGVEIVYEHPNEYLVVSASEGVYKYPAVLASGKPPNSHIQYYPSAPKGLEDSARVGNTFWSASESGARYYQLRPTNPWTFFYPFIYTFEPSTMTWRRPTDWDFKKSQ
jgi:hypothetical protein